MPGRQPLENWRQRNGGRSASLEPGWGVDGSRRRVLAGGAVLLAAHLTGCAGDDPADQGPSLPVDTAAPRPTSPPASPPASPARIAPPAASTTDGDLAPGQTIELGEGRRPALLHLPSGFVPSESRLVVSLHGAGADAGAGLALFRPVADGRGWVVLAPSSGGPTWDAVGGRYGTDVREVEALLAEATTRAGVSLDAAAVGGFSDGASYALGLALANGDLFDAVVAFSPGFVPDAPPVGRPRVFVSHGTGDEVLPIERTSRRIVPRLRRDGYDVTYREFDGGHTVPAPILDAAADWLSR